jgi:hypothetical protein
MIDRADGSPPAYGTPKWLALEDGDVRKVAAVVIAAENWARDGDELEERLRLEVEMAREAFKAEEDAEYASRRDGHRAEWGHLRIVSPLSPLPSAFRGTGRGESA